jgi:flagellar motility protein MotE (MotC chaperone)
METLLSVDEVEREVLHLREQNQMIVGELSKVIEEITALQKKLRIEMENLEEGYKRLGGKGGTRMKKQDHHIKTGYLRMNVS